MIPLYGFLEGDTLGLLMLVEADTTLGELATKLRSAARLRADPGERVTVWVNDRPLDLQLRVSDAKLEALDRFEVRRASS
ncbi:MAG TPA: toluene-4-monooxygenase system B family protein [Polyangiales bacterium]|nr:toluene-4-monooxygenase system B family protein [Polyangiales bacterium]